MSAMDKKLQEQVKTLNEFKAGGLLAMILHDQKSEEHPDPDLSCVIDFVFYHESSCVSFLYF